MQKQQSPALFKRNLRKWVKKIGAAATITAIVGSMGFSESQPAHATPVYEIEGSWGSDTPAEVKSGDVVSTIWNYNVNDDSPEPSNDPVDDVTLTLVAQNATFTTLPSVCLTEEVTPVSEISSDGLTLTCNVGVRDQGSAELIVTGLLVNATDGESITVTGNVGGVSADLPPIPVRNPFALDLKFDGSVWNETSSANSAYEQFALPWSLRHGTNGPAGPNSVTYQIQIIDQHNQSVEILSPDGCVPLDDTFSGYPRSDAAAPADQRAQFPTCTLTKNSTNNFTLTISGLDYTQTALPTKDGVGVDLPSNWDVIASGKLMMHFPYSQSGQMSVKIDAPTYESDTGSVAQDDESNNTHELAYTRGFHTAGWQPETMVPRPTGGYWTDTFRQLAGGPIRQGAGIAPTTGGNVNEVCSILDTKYVEFTQAAVGTANDDGSIESEDNAPIWYYIGSDPLFDPASAGYNPNAFDCDSGWGSSDWVETPPSDLSLVKAVRTRVGDHSLYDMANGRIYVMLFVDSEIKPNVAEGQDIWAWGSHRYDADSEYVWKWIDDAWVWTTNTWENEKSRSMNPADQASYGVATPDARYPFTDPWRDVMRVIGAEPHIVKTVDAVETIPGATVNYTLRYRAEGMTDITVPNYTVTDQLPEGMTYVPGSSSIPPTSVEGQSLTWNFPAVDTNTDYYITFSAMIPSTAEPGDTFTNSAMSTIGDLQATSTASTKIKDSGLTLLTKTAENDKVPHSGGVANDSWTVRITSADVKSQAFTDTIDVLPYNEDGRGTNFTGTYVLSGPVTAVEGAEVYYTTAAPDTIVADPADLTNGSAGDPTGNTVGWTTTFSADATAVRVIGPALAPSAQQEFTIPVVTAGASHEDIYVNVAEARAERTKLIMRTSSRFEIAAVNSIALKKYVQDADGGWHDAQNVDDYPTYYAGDTVPYRLVVTNTGDETLTDVQITDDRVDLAGLNPLPEGFEAGAVIPELHPGEDNAVTIEYSTVLSDEASEGSLINIACAIPADTDIDESCDPAGILVEMSTLSWEKVNAAEASEYLAGSEWSLVRVDTNGDPVDSAITVTDCIEDSASDCSGPDVNPGAGKFKIADLTAGDYVLIETRAPAGYILDDTPREITVRGDTAFQVPIENEQREGLVIPLTGGVGSTSFMIGAILLTGLAAVFVIVQRTRTRQVPRQD